MFNWKITQSSVRLRWSSLSNECSDDRLVAKTRRPVDNTSLTML